MGDIMPSGPNDEHAYALQCCRDDEICSVPSYCPGCGRQCIEKPVPLYQMEGLYNNADIQDARDKCSAISMRLCRIGQLFNAVYNEGYDDLCYSGFFEGEYDGQ